MGAKDYVFVEGVFGNTYLAKKTKSNKIMSNDRRQVLDNEILGLFETFLKRDCINNKSDEISVTFDGEVIYTVKLKGKLLNEVKEEIKNNKDR